MTNIVHEQCPNSDSEIVLSPKTGWVHQVHSLLTQPTHPGEHRRTQASAWLCRHAPSRPCRGHSGCVMARRRPCRRRCMVVSWAWPPAVLRHSNLAPFLVTIHLGVLRYKSFSSQVPYVTIQLSIVTPAANPFSLSHNTACCLAIQFPNQQASFMLQYNFSHCTPKATMSRYNGILQYTHKPFKPPKTCCVTIQFPIVL